MPKCPSCGKNVDNPSKEWKYGPKSRPGAHFLVRLYKCSCGKTFREYIKQ